MPPRVKGFTLVELLPGMLIGLIMVVSVILLYRYVSAALEEGIHSIRLRGKVYEFIACFNREAQTAVDIRTAAGGYGIEIIPADVNKAIKYEYNSSDGDKYLYANGEKLFEISGVDFVNNRGMASASVWFTNGVEISVYSYKRISESP